MMLESLDSKASVRAIGAASGRARRKRYLSKLRHILITRFSEEELRTLCWDLPAPADVDYDDLSGEGKAGKARELIGHLERRDLIPALVEIGKRLRPTVNWGETSPAGPGTRPDFQRTPLERPPHKPPPNQYGVAAGTEPAAEASAFTRDTLADRRAHIIKKMSKTVDELDAYIEQYGRAISAHRFSAILRERTKRLRDLQPSDERWEAYWEATEPIYDELEGLAWGMSEWREAHRPKKEPSEITVEFKAKFGLREQRVLELVDQYTEAHDRAKTSRSELRRLRGEQDDRLLRELRDSVKDMHTNADKMCRELYQAITELIKRELNTQLAELGQPPERS